MYFYKKIMTKKIIAIGGITLIAAFIAIGLFSISDPGLYKGELGSANENADLQEILNTEDFRCLDDFEKEMIIEEVNGLSPEELDHYDHDRQSKIAHRSSSKWSEWYDQNLVRSMEQMTTREYAAYSLGNRTCDEKTPHRGTSSPELTNIDGSLYNNR